MLFENMTETHRIYTVELTLDEFLSLHPSMPLKPLNLHKRYTNLKSIADVIIKDYNGDFAAVEYANRHFLQCRQIYDTFEWRKFGVIHLADITDRTLVHTIADGNHRSVALSLLLVKGEIEYQPVKALVGVNMQQD